MGMFKIALDAGHGMNTPGKRCLKSLDPKETREWFLNDRIARLIEEKLAVYDGYELIRVDDTTGTVDISLNIRTQVANAWGADIYLSVHHNAGVNGGYGGGVVSIAYTKASELSLEYQKLIYDELIGKTGLKGNRSIPCPRQNLQVLRETNMPAVLVECGFMDSVTDVPVILTEQFANAAAEGMVAALVKIGNLTEKKGNVMECDKGFVELTEINDIVWELSHRGIITDNGLWLNKLKNDSNSYWLARKCLKYIRECE